MTVSESRIPSDACVSTGTRTLLCSLGVDENSGAIGGTVLSERVPLPGVPLPGVCMPSVGPEFLMHSKTRALHNPILSS